MLREANGGGGSRPQPKIARTLIPPPNVYYSNRANQYQFCFSCLLCCTSAVTRRHRQGRTHRTNYTTKVVVTAPTKILTKPSP